MEYYVLSEEELIDYTNKVRNDRDNLSLSEP